MLQMCEMGNDGVFIVNFEHISHVFSSVSIVEFEQVNVCCDMNCNDIEKKQKLG